MRSLTVPAAARAAIRQIRCLPPRSRERFERSLFEALDRSSGGRDSIGLAIDLLALLDGLREVGRRN